MAATEVNSLVQAANARVGLVLLTRAFVERVELNAFGDVCVAGFRLAQQLPNVIVGAMEPGLACAGNWGWNAVLARLSGQVIYDFSPDEGCAAWDGAIGQLVKTLDPRAEVPEPAGPTEPGAPHPDAVPSARRLADPLEAQHAAPDGFHRHRYDCFVSYSPTADLHKRDNRKRVLQAAQFLQRGGLSVFVTEWERHRFQNEDEAMVYGMRQSSVALMFLTRSYVHRIEEGHISDTCVAEFNLAKRAPHVIPIIMEEEMLNYQRWGWSKVFAHLAGHSFVNLSNDCGSGLWSQLWSDGVQRWYCALTALEVRVREAPACVTSLRGAPPSPVVPHRDLVALVAGLLFLAGALLCASKPSCAAHPAQDLASLASCTIWAAAQGLVALWLLHGARMPPTFEINSLMIPWKAMAPVACQMVGLALRAGQPLACLLEKGEQTAKNFGLAGNLAVAFGGALALVEIALVPREDQRSIDAQSFLAARNLQHWARAWLLAAACSLAVAVLLDSQALAAVGGGGAVLAASLVLALWLYRTPAVLRQYYQGMAQAYCDGDAPCQEASADGRERGRGHAAQTWRDDEALALLKPKQDMAGGRAPLTFLQQLARDPTCTLDFPASESAKISATSFGQAAVDPCEHRIGERVSFFVLQRVEATLPVPLPELEPPSGMGRTQQEVHMLAGDRVADADPAETGVLLPSEPQPEPDAVMFVV